MNPKSCSGTEFGHCRLKGVDRLRATLLGSSELEISSGTLLISYDRCFGGGGDRYSTLLFMIYVGARQRMLWLINNPEARKPSSPAYLYAAQNSNAQTQGRARSV